MITGSYAMPVNLLFCPPQSSSNWGLESIYEYCCYYYYWKKKRFWISSNPSIFEKIIVVINTGESKKGMWSKFKEIAATLFPLPFLFFTLRAVMRLTLRTDIALDPWKWCSRWLTGHNTAWVDIYCQYPVFHFQALYMENIFNSNVILITIH